eukprot:6214810-Pleurochrysis_carterae.AAC.5
MPKASKRARRRKARNAAAERRLLVDDGEGEVRQEPRDEKHEQDHVHSCAGGEAVHQQVPARRTRIIVGYPR